MGLTIVETLHATSVGDDVARVGASLRCDKGEPVARRASKATGLFLEVARLPNSWGFPTPLEGGKGCDRILRVIDRLRISAS
jgi:hypothetical protein